MSSPKMTAKREDRRIVYQGRIFRLEVDQVVLPGGQRVALEIVRHPGSVVLLPMLSPDRIVLIRQYRYAIDRWIWELPAGSLEPDEDPVAGATRECEEEIGLVPGRVERLQSFYPTPGFCDELMIFFRCTELREPSPDSVAHKDEDEDLEPREFSLADARALIAQGEIVDMKTVVGLTLIDQLGGAGGAGK
jgi:ADP-ribose pyrophosphatase